MTKKKFKYEHVDEYIKANRRGSREGELMDNPGFKSKDRSHKNFKKYSRKNSMNDLIFVEE